MGCKGSKHAWHDGVGVGVPQPEKMRCSSGMVVARRGSVAVRSSSSSSLGTLSLDRGSFAGVAAEGIVMVKGGGGCYNDGKRVAAPVAGQEKRNRRVPPRTPTKTPLRAPEEINVWELMAGLDDDYDEEEEEEEEMDCHGGEREVKSAPGSPAFDPKAVDELPPEPHAKKGTEIQMFPGVVRARIILFQKEIDAKLAKKAPPPPESARRVVVYLTSLRGIRQTYEDCCATSAILRGYGVRVDERDLSLHAGYKDELRAALGHGRPLPQVFVDGRHLGGADDVRRMHESGELTGALLDACDTAAPVVGKGSSEPCCCGGCGGVRFVPCDVCSGSCKVFVADDEDGGAGGGAFRRCPECNENGLVRCPVC
uniref:Glutaredoxin domain-containing protein n=1 Tax=Leersia perrieri TaxID=77586 RepID=A0A0D9WNI8_9ORYZ